MQLSIWSPLAFHHLPRGCRIAMLGESQNTPQETAFSMQDGAALELALLSVGGSEVLDMLKEVWKALLI